MSDSRTFDIEKMSEALEGINTNFVGLYSKISDMKYGQDTTNNQLSNIGSSLEYIKESFYGLVHNIDRIADILERKENREIEDRELQKSIAVLKKALSLDKHIENLLSSVNK